MFNFRKDKNKKMSEKTLKELSSINSHIVDMVSNTNKLLSFQKSEALRKEQESIETLYFIKKYKEEYKLARKNITVDFTELVNGKRRFFPILRDTVEPETLILTLNGLEQKEGFGNDFLLLDNGIYMQGDPLDLTDSLVVHYEKYEVRYSTRQRKKLK